MDNPDDELNTSAMNTVINNLFSGKNQLAVNFDADINLKGNPINDIISPAYKNQKDFVINKLTIDPIKVNAHPIFTLVSIPYFSLIIFPGMIIKAEKIVKLTINKFR